MTSFDHNMRSRSFRLLLKRGFDIVVSAAGLIVLSPLFLLTSLAIKLETRGSIFSSRLEFCYNDQTIRTIRFRNTGSYVGHFLVRSGLDRLPMLINVLRGDMSIVGPRCDVIRPSLPLAKELARALTNSPLKPGIVGPEDQGGSELRLIETDLFYVSNWSLLLDAKILLATLLSKASYIQPSPRR